MGSINVAIIGVETCASSLGQEANFYRKADESTSVPEPMHTNAPPRQFTDEQAHIFTEELIQPNERGASPTD